MSRISIGKRGEEGASRETDHGEEGVSMLREVRGKETRGEVVG